VDGNVVAVLTDTDSQRLLAPTRGPRRPAALRQPPDYLYISYQLVRGGIRFGANNWTPVRARSDVEPVNRNILRPASSSVSSTGAGSCDPRRPRRLEEAERAVIVENLCARVTCR
jgi:hypothetical protein